MVSVHSEVQRLRALNGSRRLESCDDCRSDDRYPVAWVVVIASVAVGIADFVFAFAYRQRWLSMRQPPLSLYKGQHPASSLVAELPCVVRSLGGDCGPLYAQGPRVRRGERK
jgi:hypothetical protein